MNQGRYQVGYAYMGGSEEDVLFDTRSTFADAKALAIYLKEEHPTRVPYVVDTKPYSNQSGRWYVASDRKLYPA